MIKWRKKDEELLKKKLANYMSKRRRVEKKGNIPTELLPERKTYKQLKKEITTREQFNTEISLLDSFLARHSTNSFKTNRGAVIPYYLKHQTEIKLEVINKQRRQQKREYGNMSATDRNKRMGKLAKNVKELNVSHIREKKFNFKNMSRKELQMFMVSVQAYKTTVDEKNEMYRANYYEALDEELTPEQSEEIKKILSKMPTKTLIYKFYTDLNLDIDFVYSLTEQEQKFEILRDAWTELVPK